MKWYVVIVLGVLSTSTELYATTWNCKNDVEIQCDDVSCTSTKGGEFTPMDVRFDTKGSFSACAYSGCWNGKGRVVANGSLIVVQKRLADLSEPNVGTERREDISIMFSTTDRIALVKAGQFVLPMHCTKPD